MTQDDSRSALFVGIPAVGHLNPLLQQAMELRRRSWRVALASTNEQRGYVEDGFPNVRFVNLGPDPMGAVGNAALQARVSAASSFLSGTFEIMRWVNRLWPSMFDGLLAEIRRERPDVMVVDLVTSAGIDAAEVEGVPYVVNNADLLTTISVALLPPAPWVPLLFSGRSIRSISTLDRLLNPLLRWLGSTVIDATLGTQLNRLRQTRGLEPRRMSQRPAGVLIMTNSAFGLEYNRPLPPLFQMVGPMLADPLPDALPDELRNWLETGPAVVFVNFGTIARPAPAVLEQIAVGLASEEFRALWVLRDEPPASMPANARVERWVASQIDVLAHPNVRVFLSHCGVNSVHESLFAGTPIVGVPMLADQRDMAMRVEDAGVGRVLDKRHVTADSVRQAIFAVLRDSTFRRNVAPIQSSFALAGGVRRAADLIEHAAQVGVDHYAAGWRAT